MRLLRSLFSLVLFLVFSCAAVAAEYHGRVTWVYDGDTVKVEGVGKVRLLGIDTPETETTDRDRFYLDRFGIDEATLRTIARRAKARTMELSKGVMVRLESDGDGRDKYGRLLAYLYLPDGRMLNRLLIEEGLATVFRKGEYREKKAFEVVEKDTRDASRGMWGSR